MFQQYDTTYYDGKISIIFSLILAALKNIIDNPFLVKILYLKKYMNFQKINYWRKNDSIRKIK